MRRIFLGALVVVAALEAQGDLPWWKDGVHGSEIEIVAEFLPQNPVILEAGAHCGEDTMTLAARWPDGVVHAFEPLPEYFNTLSERTQKISNVRAYPFGLFSETGEYTLHISRIWKGAASILPDNFLPGNPYDDTQATIYCKNLEEWSRESGVDHIDYMWLDMEGVELEMLRAAPNLLKTVKAVSTEVNFREFRKGTVQFDALKAFMEERGFVLHKIWENPPNTPNWQATAVFIRS